RLCRYRRPKAGAAGSPAESGGLRRALGFVEFHRRERHGAVVPVGIDRAHAELEVVLGRDGQGHGGHQPRLGSVWLDSVARVPKFTSVWIVFSIRCGSTSSSICRRFRSGACGRTGFPGGGVTFGWIPPPPSSSSESPCPRSR